LPLGGKEVFADKKQVLIRKKSHAKSCGRCILTKTENKSNLRLGGFSEDGQSRSHRGIHGKGGGFKVAIMTLTELQHIKNDDPSLGETDTLITEKGNSLRRDDAAPNVALSHCGVHWGGGGALLWGLWAKQLRSVAG